MAFPTEIFGQILGAFSLEHKKQSGCSAIYVNTNDEYVEATFTCTTYAELQAYKDKWNPKQLFHLNDDYTVLELGLLKQFCRLLRTPKYFENKRDKT